MWVSKLESCICGYFWHKQICMCIFWELTIPSGTIYKWYSKLLIKVIPKLFLNSMLFGSCKPGAFGAQYEGSLLSWEASGSGQSSLFPPPDVADAPTSPILICLSAHLLPLLRLSHLSWGPGFRMHRSYRWLFFQLCSFNFGVRWFLQMTIYQKLLNLHTFFVFVTRQMCPSSPLQEGKED